MSNITAVSTCSPRHQHMIPTRPLPRYELFARFVSQWKTYLTFNMHSWYSLLFHGIITSVCYFYFRIVPSPFISHRLNHSFLLRRLIRDLLFLMTSLPVAIGNTTSLIFWKYCGVQGTQKLRRLFCTIHHFSLPNMAKTIPGGT